MSRGGGLVLWLNGMDAGYDPQIRAYLTALAKWANAEGEATVTRAQLAAETGRSERTLARWHAKAESLGLVLRVDGGWKGRAQTVYLACRGGLADVAHRARWAILRRARAARDARNAARLNGFRAKGDTNGTPHTLTGVRATEPSPSREVHPFVDDGGGFCRCQLPAANRIHRGGAAA